MDDLGNNLLKYIKRFTLLVFVFTYLPLIAASVLSYFTVYWGYQTMICAIEAVILFLCFVIFFLCELIFDRKITKNDKYKAIDPNKVGDESVYASAPMRGMHFDEMNKTFKHYETEALYDIFLRKRALAELIAKLQRKEK